MKLFILGATGNSGQRLVRQALGRGHQVTALVRNAVKLRTLFAPDVLQSLQIVEGRLDDQAALVAAMQGHDVVINAAGNANDGPEYGPLVQGVIKAADAALGAGGRFWLFGGAAALDVPGTDLMTLDLPKVPAIFEVHRSNLAAVSATQLDWSMLCPGPMTAAENGQPHTGLRLSTRHWPVARPGITHCLPRIALSLAFKQKMPQMTISYEDAAQVILDHLERNGPFSRQRVGVALPAGLSRHKDYQIG
jgi:hypothetical protein